MTIYYNYQSGILLILQNYSLISYCNQFYSPVGLKEILLLNDDNIEGLLYPVYLN